MTDDRPTANRTTCDTPVRVEGHTTLHYEPAEPSGLTVEDVRLWCERLADQSRDALDNAGTEWSRDLVGCFNVGWQEGFESAYRALAEALSRGELPE